MSAPTRARFAHQQAVWLYRTQPWLGTLVTVGVHGASPAASDALFERVFGVISAIHRLMSFHESASDVSRLNRDAWREPVAVDARTFEVLRLARRLAAASSGLFDVTVAPLLVADGLLPRPAGAPAADPTARYGDIQLRRDGKVRFRKPLWIDLGGIAKGYAVDAAFQAAGQLRRASLSINAGGDLRVSGSQPVQVLLNLADRRQRLAPQLTLVAGALASSQGFAARRRQGSRWRAAHRHGRTHRDLSLTRFVSVMAPRCAIADALTKIVMARGRAAAPILRRFGAEALIHDAAQGWRRVGVRL